MSYATLSTSTSSTPERLLLKRDFALPRQQLSSSLCSKRQRSTCAQVHEHLLCLIDKDGFFSFETVVPAETKQMFAVTVISDELLSVSTLSLIAFKCALH